MRAMILAAGLGQRLQPLTSLRAKPLVPVCDHPLIRYHLEFLAHHNIHEVMINLHHFAGPSQQMIEACAPNDMELHFSYEEQLLGTGGALHAVRDFLSESDPCLVLAGDMLIDFNLTELVELHRSRQDQVTLLLRSNDPRASYFGEVGLDQNQRICQVGSRFQIAAAENRGIYTSVSLFSKRSFSTLPKREAFNHLDDWLLPQLESGIRDIRGSVLAADQFIWEPVGTLPEYLDTNLKQLRLRYFDARQQAQALGTRFMEENIFGAGSIVPDDCKLKRVVVWPNEIIPAGFNACDGVFAGGRFHSRNSAEPS